MIHRCVLAKKRTSRFMMAK